MFDIEKLSTVDIDELNADDADYWCEKLLNFSANSNESKQNLLALFEFTRGLLGLKNTQTDVLIEELQTLGKKFDSLESELDKFRVNHDSSSVRDPTIEESLEEERRQRKLAQDFLKQRNNEVASLRIEVEALRRSKTNTKIQELSEPLSTNFNNDQNRSVFKKEFAEKNAEIEQLLDRVYETDRQNLELVEKLAKSRLENAKNENQSKIQLSRIELLEIEVKEYRKLNDNLMQEREEKTRQIEELTHKIKNVQSEATETEFETNIPPEQRSSLLIRENLYNELKQEIDRLNVLIEVKDSQLQQLQNASRHSNNLERKQLEIEHLEEELSILNSTVDNTVGAGNEAVEVHIGRLKADKRALLDKVSELEREAHIKDEELERWRRRQLGDSSVRALLEENAVLSRMLTTRDAKIQDLIERFNRNQLSEDPPETKDVVELEDKLSALAVERDVLGRQITSLGAHLESVQNENTQLQTGMREILENLRNSDTHSDVVIECPSLEKLCALIENRLLSSGISTDWNEPEMSRIILVKSELDNVRGQNEQLRSEMKQLRADFLAVIDGYTTDILDNWTLPASVVSEHLSQESTANKQAPTDTETLEQVSEIQDSKYDEISKSETDINLQILKKLQQIQIKPRRRSSVHRKRSQRTQLRAHSMSQRPETESKQEGTEHFEVVDEQTQTEIRENNTKQAQESMNTTHIEVVDEETQTEVQTNLEEQLQESEKFNVAQEEKTIEHFHKQVQTQEVEKHSIEIQVELNVEQVDKQPRKSVVEDSNEEFVDMKDAATQTQKVEADAKEKIEIEVVNRSTQTMIEETTKKTEVEVVVEKVKECLNCTKQLALLRTVRSLIQKERQQFRLQSERSHELIEKLRQNLTVTKQEYEHDLDSHKNVIDDLRAKLRETNKLTYSLANTSNITPEEMRPHEQNKHNQESSTEIVVSHAPESHESKRDISKTILETSIACLQNCLKQKEEALSEYRKLVDDMRASILRPDTHGQTKSDALIGRGGCDFQIALTNFQNEETELAKNVRELMLKPYVQQNEDLNCLLQKTFTELKTLREGNARQMQSLKNELDSKCKILVELARKHELDRKEKTNMQEQIKESVQKEENYKNKIDKLNARITELSKRTVSVAGSAAVDRTTGARKKVENSVFQESADLRLKNGELHAQMKKIEMERWNLEKKLEQERHHWRRSLTEKEKVLANHDEQVTKLHTLISKLEKQIRAAKKPQIPVELPKVVQETPRFDRTTQTDVVKTVRFEDERREVSKLKEEEIVKQYEILTEELQRQLEQSLKREKFSSVIKEIMAVGENILESTQIEDTTATTAAVAEEKSPPSCLVVERSRSSSILKPCEIYDQLMDMQFERLVSENAHLKVQLKLREESERLQILVSN